jgi:hypothetical protein
MMVFIFGTLFWLLQNPRRSQVMITVSGNDGMNFDCYGAAPEQCYHRLPNADLCGFSDAVKRADERY